MALDDRTIEEFVRHLSRCRCSRYGHTHTRDIRKGARLFLRYARFADIVTTRSVEEVHVDPPLLVSFCDWMRRQRGTCDATLYGYSIPVRTQAGLEQYLKRRRAFTALDDHLFVSLRRRPLLLHDAETEFHDIVEKIGLPRGEGLPRPTIHSLRHTFAVRLWKPAQMAAIES